MSNKDEKTRVSMMMSKPLRARIKVEAKKQCRNFSLQCEYLLDLAIEIENSIKKNSPVR